MKSLPLPHTTTTEFEFCLGHFFWRCWGQATLHDLCDLSSPPGMQPVPSAVKAQSPDRWTAREFPCLSHFQY